MRRQSWDRTLRRGQLDRILAGWRSLGTQPRPRRGWIREIREAIGMSARQLAGRVGVSQPTVAEFEKREVAGTITLASLERAAEALDCHFVYAFLPRDSLEAMIRARAERIAAGTVDRVAHTMRLEGQETSGDRSRQIAEEVEILLQTRSRELWDEPR